MMCSKNHFVLKNLYFVYKKGYFIHYPSKSLL